MTQTIAAALREGGQMEGSKKGQEAAKMKTLRRERKTLLLSLQIRFGRVPLAIERVVRATKDSRNLEIWLYNSVIAETLADVGISTTQNPSLL